MLSLSAPIPEMHGAVSVIVQKTISPRKSEEDVMIKFCKSYEVQKQSFAVFFKIGALKNFANFTGKHLY